MASKSSTFAKVFISLLLTVVVAGGIGFVLYFSNNLTTDLSSFYVQYGSTEYRRDNDSLALSAGVTHNFECKYILGFPSTETGAHYSVKIAPNKTDENIEYKVDGYRSSYYPNDKLDFAAAFGLTKYTDSFTITIPNDLTLLKAVSSAYEGKTVTEVPDKDLTEKNYFQLVVSSYDDKTVIRINFRLLR